MRFDRTLLAPIIGALLLAVAVVALGAVAMRWRRPAPALATAPAAKPAPSVPLPKTLTREGARFVKPPAPVSVAAPAPTVPPPLPVTHELPLVLFSAAREIPSTPLPAVAPYGRLIPCETVLALESNRLDTPIIGLVTEDVWHDGRCVIPAGAEVHGRATLDRTRERIGAQVGWKIIWRNGGADNGTELSVDGLVLDRDTDPAKGTWGATDGSAGLRGTVVRSPDQHELKLFAATFLASATSALQENRATTGLVGEMSLPVATARNATLAGTGAVLREYAQQLKDAIGRDGFYLRVPAGKAFYLYVTQTLDRSQARRATTSAPSAALLTP